MDATARRAWVRARILTYLQGLSIHGAPRLQDAEERRRGSEPGPWLRVALGFDPEQYVGRYNETLVAYRVPVILTCDLFWPGAETDAVRDLYAIDRAADDLEDALRDRSLDLRDYTDPQSPVSIPAAPLYFSRLTRRGGAELPPENGLLRRQIVAEGFWFLRHSD